MYLFIYACMHVCMLIIIFVYNILYYFMEMLFFFTRENLYFNVDYLLSKYEFGTIQKWSTMSRVHLH